MARRIKFNKVEIRVDSSKLVQDVKETKRTMMHGRNLITKIRSMWDLDWEIEINHVYKEEINLAHAMASYSFVLKEEFSFFEDCPDGFKDILRNDESGISIPIFFRGSFSLLGRLALSVIKKLN